jgi:FHA domain
LFEWFRRKRAEPKRGSRGARRGAGRPEGGRNQREPTEYLEQGGRSVPPPPEPYVPPAPLAREPEPWTPPARPAPASSPAPSRSESGASDKTIFLTNSGESADLVAALVGISGVLKNRLYPVFAAENHLGREGTGGVFHADDRAISRDHGRLRWNDGKFHIRPVADHAISVNGERLSEDGEFLHDGDTLQLGQTTFRFKVL